MEDKGTVASIATQPVDPNPEPKPKVVAVIWGCLYKESFKTEMRENLGAKELEPIPEKPEEAAPPQPQPQLLAPAPVDSQDAPKPKGHRVTIEANPVPKLVFDIPAEQGRFSVIKTLDMTFNIEVSPEDSKDDAGGSDKKASKSAARPRKNSATGSPQGREKHPRISVPEQMGWAQLSQNGQPHPDNDNRNVASHEVGPLTKSKPTNCNIENDIFIFDRNVLSALERPHDCGNLDVDIFKNRQTDKARKDFKDKVLLRIKNVAFNVNDPGSVMIYFDMIIRTYLNAEVEGEFDKKTLTFFSGPLFCDHEDCDVLRARIDRKYRTSAPKFALKHPTWTLGDFCLRTPASITFLNAEHAQDAMCGPAIPDNERLNAEQSYQVMMWYRAMLNHHPLGLTAPGQGRTQFSIFRFEKKFPLLVDNANGCMMHRRATNDMDRIAPSPDPRTLPCKLCGATGFEMGYYDKTEIPVGETGLMYLHYSDDEKYREEYVRDPADEENLKKGKRGRGRGKGKEKEKEKAVNAQDDCAGANAGSSGTSTASNNVGTTADTNAGTDNPAGATAGANDGASTSNDAGAGAGASTSASTASSTTASAAAGTTAGALADTSAGTDDPIGTTADVNDGASAGTTASHNVGTTASATDSTAAGTSSDTDNPVGATAGANDDANDGVSTSNDADAGASASTGTDSHVGTTSGTNDSVGTSTGSGTVADASAVGAVTVVGASATAGGENDEKGKFEWLW
ncbi:hypothetical protein ABKA04_009626 [Annulohypoxylon sp. FPYF3050]